MGLWDLFRLKRETVDKPRVSNASKPSSNDRDLHPVTITDSNEADRMDLHGSVTHSHPIYTDGSLILIGDKVRSFGTVDGHYFEGEVTAITSTSLFCLPWLNITLHNGICDDLYMTERAPRNQIFNVSKLERAKLKLARNEDLSADERAILLEATARHNIGL